MKKSSRNRIVYLEFIRIFAIFLVIFNHTSEMGFFLFADYPTDTIRFWGYMTVSVFCKVAVPLFFAVSGALLLGKESEGIVKIWKNRILKMIIILIVFSSINYVNDCWKFGKTFKFSTLIESLYTGPGLFNGHMWYLYAYIVFLICLPFLQAFVKNLDNKCFQYMIIIFLVMQVLHVLEYFYFLGEKQISEIAQNNLWIMTDVVIYPCIGYYMHHRLDKTSIKKKIWIVWGLNLIGIGISCYMTYYVGKITGELNEGISQQFFNSFVLLNCICVFITAIYLFESIQIPDWINKMILSVGKTTFGIYLLHQLVKCYFNHYEIVPKIRAYGVDSLVAVILYCFGVLIVSYVITAILLKIPVVKRLIGG